MRSIRRILFASDFSKPSDKAFVIARALARSERAMLIVLHVIVPPIPFVPEQYIDGEAWDRVDAQVRRWSLRHLAKLTEKAKGARIRAVGLLLEGDPAQQIVRAARSKHADLLVLGTHGRTGLKKLLVGSVASRVVATASCPVVTVRST